MRSTLLSRLTRRRTAAESPPAAGQIELQAAGAGVVIVPELGGRITALELGGRQWLADHGSVAGSPSDGELARGAATGYIDCFPTVAACRVGPRQGGPAVELPALGELWTLRPEVKIATLDGAVEAACTWTGERMAYELTRVVRASPGTITMRYVVRNTGAASLPFIWAANVALPLGDATRIALPENARARVLAQYGVDFLGVGAEHKWPRFRTAKKLVDMTVPDAIGPRYACHLAFDMPVGVVAVIEGSRRLEARFDVDQVPHLGLALRKRVGGGLERGLTLQPAIGVPDALAHVGGLGVGAALLEPGATREWSIAWRATSE